MRWWCSAQDVAWSWTWRPYVGVWVLLAAIAVAYVVASRDDGRVPSGRRRAAFWLGLLALWVALDWPLGALAGGYLASAHMVQFLLVGMIAPLLMAVGLQPETQSRLVASTGPVGRWITRPVPALLAFNLVVVVTHWPRVVDGLMASQAGSFAIDASWFAAGVVFWWPVVSDVPRRPEFEEPHKIGYLIAATILALVPFVYLTFTRLPVYETYELAPPTGWISAREDQRLAGLLMKFGGGAIVWTMVAILFFRWALREETGP